MLLTLGWTLFFLLCFFLPMLQSIQSNTGTRYEKLLAASNRPLSQRRFDREKDSQVLGGLRQIFTCILPRERSFGNSKENKVPRPKIVPNFRSTLSINIAVVLRDPGPRPALS
jgi:hypothetical protein